MMKYYTQPGDTQKRHPHLGSVRQYVTLSLGVAAMTPSLEATPEMLIAMADKALYQAKEQGRNKVCFASRWQCNDPLLPPI